LKSLDPFTLPLQSTHLIEASAGTGKSWTVTLLYLRLIIEKGLSVDQILVVTFTEAATKELREKVRERLVDVLDYFLHPDKPSEYQTLFESVGDIDQEEVMRRLQQAKLSLDEAAIFTIHSFCQRALHENAFEAGLPFESELLSSDRALMQQLTDDFWRRNFYHAPRALLYQLGQKNITPDSLLEDIWKYVGKPYLQYHGPQQAEISDDEWQHLARLFKQVMGLWEQHKEEIKRLVLNNKNLNGNKYRMATVEKNCQQLDAIQSLSDINKKLLEKDLARFKTSRLVNGTKAKCVTPEHPFFNAWEAFSDYWEAIDARSDAYLAQIRIKLLQFLQTELPKEKRRLGVLAFDDLLLQLQSTLQQQPHLAQQLRQQYQAALIDEFQDTDPVQYAIFSTIYPPQGESAVYLVGDPKQAIYRFRGGDIYTYLQAKSAIDQDRHFTLKTNWRSHPDLIQAMNTLYGECQEPFRDAGISYIDVSAGDKIQDNLNTPDKHLPLRFWKLEPDADNSKVDAIRKVIADTVAGDIADLLNAAQNQAKPAQASIGDKPLDGGDIAVLVRTHSEGELIKQALNTRGIASVQSSNKSIFETHEANEIMRLLVAIDAPQHESNVRRALVTDMLGYQAQDLLAFEAQENLWEEKLLAMQNWQALWKKQGFLPMMRSLMREEQVTRHLLSFADGERRVSNVLHLSELIHQYSHQQSMGIPEVIAWLQRQQQNAHQSEAELRLESDETLVKIVTIHKSKGLEYPIVYCPFVGIGTTQNNTNKIFSFHQNKQACLEIGSPDYAAHKAIKEAEENAEATRLLYVALTRAKYQCTVVCVPGAIKRRPDNSALGWLLTNGQVPKDPDFYQSYQDRLAELNQSEVIEVKHLPQFDPDLHYRHKAIQPDLTARQFSAVLRHQDQVTSFSGLTSGAHDEMPDYDAQAAHLLPAPATEQDVTEFPRGATAGTCLHEIFENIDFSQALDKQRPVIQQMVNKWGFAPIHEEAAIRLIENTLQTEIMDGFSLNQLKTSQRLDEMAFYLPLERLHIEKLRQILYQHLPDDWQVVRNAVSRLSFEQVEGYLKGFIDLIFEYEGKYYLADYKSNTLADYQTDDLLTTMADSHYYLQYLLYSVALHRYLQKRLPDYQWDTHMGGVFYLFIRGMSPKSIKTGGGVFYHRPHRDLIHAMDDLFMEALL